MVNYTVDFHEDFNWLPSVNRSASAKVGTWSPYHHGWISVNGIFEIKPYPCRYLNQNLISRTSTVWFLQYTVRGINQAQSARKWQQSIQQPASRVRQVNHPSFCLAEVSRAEELTDVNWHDTSPSPSFLSLLQPQSPSTFPPFNPTTKAECSRYKMCYGTLRLETAMEMFSLRALGQSSGTLQLALSNVSPSFVPFTPPLPLHAILLPPAPRGRMTRAVVARVGSDCMWHVPGCRQMATVCTSSHRLWPSLICRRQFGCQNVM